MWRSQTLVVLLAAAAGAQDFFLCPEEEITGTFADPDYCDRYWKCFKGEATMVKCSDGLVFDPTRITNSLTNLDPCDYIYKVDCYGRDVIDEPRGVGVCERMNGVYPHEDLNVCDQYYTCKENVATRHNCAPGLHFNPDNKLCDWPSAANRGACEALASLDGFTCDNKEYFTKDGQKIVHPRFPHPEDCTKFYVCKAGKTPAISGCSEGEVFNADTSVCDLPENVPECNPDYVYEEYPDGGGEPLTGTPTI